MVLKVQESVGQKLQRKCFCKQEKTFKSMGFLTLWNYFWSLSVALVEEIHVSLNFPCFSVIFKAQTLSIKAS